MLFISAIFYSTFTHLFTFFPTTAAADDSKIVNGVPQAANSVKFMANIKRSGNLMCGGSLLNEKYIISAAHCEYRCDREYGG